VTERDGETRDRVLRVATSLFAARGFKKVTIREICHEAGANVAAVNYHFGDKLGLYREVLGAAIGIMQATTDLAREAGQGKSAEEQLRAYVRVFMERVIGGGRDSWIHQLMSQEMADPTPAIDLISEQVIRPRMAYVGGIVGDILGAPADSEDVRLCVLSIQSQCHAAMSNPLAKRLLPDVYDDRKLLERLATHIADFSVGGVRGLRSIRS
jgi:TetR/AcrR family transcriptional regulator, regulator of cefoperazone and chloramphenicol sensitivity